MAGTRKDTDDAAEGGARLSLTEVWSELTLLI